MDDKQIEAKFWSKVARLSDDECWPWRGYKAPDGRGWLRVNKRNTPAPRVALWLAGRQTPEGKPFALHSCDNPNCVNPAHLRWGDYVDNHQDRVSRKRGMNESKTHCIRGHEFSGYNLIIRNGTQRQCRECLYADKRAYYARTKGRLPHLNQ